MWCNCKRYVQPQSLQKLHINKYMIDLGGAKEKGGVGERNFGAPDGPLPHILRRLRWFYPHERDNLHQTDPL